MVIGSSTVSGTLSNLVRVQSVEELARDRVLKTGWHFPPLPHSFKTALLIRPWKGVSEPSISLHHFASGDYSHESI